MQNPLRRVPFFSVISAAKLSVPKLNAIGIDISHLKKKNKSQAVFTHFYIEILTNSNGQSRPEFDGSISKIENNTVNSNR